MSPESRAYARLVAVALFLFLLLSDWVVLGGPLLLVRRALVAAVALVAVPYAARHRRAVVCTLLAPPLVFFAAFLAAGLALAPFAPVPGSAAFHTLVFAGLTLFAVAVAGTVSLAATLAVVRVTLALKLVGSLLLGLFGRHVAGSGILGSMGMSLDQRHYFGGLFGNPNPLGDAAAAYLLLTTCHLIERGQPWPTGRRGVLEIAWYTLTIPVSAYLMWQSLSRGAWVALAAVSCLLGLLGQWRITRTALSRRRRSLSLIGFGLGVVVATPLLLICINISQGRVNLAGTTADRLWEAFTSGTIFDIKQRQSVWDPALKRIREKPWTGYGMSATPLIYASESDGSLEPERAHNLVLEAALYAGIPASLLIVLFAVSSLRSVARAFMARRPFALSLVAVLFFLFLLAQVEPLIFGSPYPSLLIVLILAVHLGLPRDIRLLFGSALPTRHDDGR